MTTHSTFNTTFYSPVQKLETGNNLNIFLYPNMMAFMWITALKNPL